MKEKSSQKSPLFIIIRFISDLYFIPIVFILAYTAKFKVGWIFHNLLDIPLGKIYQHAQIEPYLYLMGIIVVLWLNAFYLAGMYQPFSGFMPLIDEFVRVVKGVSVGSAEIMVFSFFYKSFPGSRYVLIYAWILGILVLFLARMIIASIERYFLKRGVGASPVLIVGADPIGQDLAERLLMYPTFRLRYIGTIASEFPQKLHYHLKNRFQHLGDYSQLQTIIKKYEIEKIFLTEINLPKKEVTDLVEYCDQNGVELNILSNIAEIKPGTNQVIEMEGLPFVQFGFSDLPLGLRFMKRLMDILISGIGLVVFSPFFLGVALLIKWFSSQGPVFYIQERVGKDGRPFNMVKFRTMVPEAEKSTGPVMVNQQQEARYIPLGQLLRTLSVDELPQLWNVLKGDMSLVGPRPERPYFVEKLKKIIPFYDLRHQVRGGITGWAQVNGRSALTDRPEHKIKYDIHYIKHASLLLDFKILLKTIWVVLHKEESY